MFRYACLFCVVLSLVTGCHEKAKPPQVTSVDVTDYVVEAKTIPASFDFVGFAESTHPVEIRARVEGYLDKIAYQEGQLVQQGDLLFQLDPKQFEAKVEEAKGEVARQKALLENAILTVNRLTPLYAQNAASKKDLDNAIASQLAYEASLQTAQASLLNAQINLGYTTITSPITGYTARSRYHEGALIIPGPENLMTTVSVLDPIWVYFSISDNDILRAWKLEQAKMLSIPMESNAMTIPANNEWVVEAILSDGSSFPYKGRFDYSAPTYDQATATMMGRAVFPNPRGEMRPGLFVRIRLHGATRPDAIVVPQRALLQKKGGMFVYLIDQDNKAVMQDVSTSNWYGDYQIITNGLKPGDRIIVDGINKVRPGAEVHITGPWNPESGGKGKDNSVQ